METRLKKILLFSLLAVFISASTFSQVSSSMAQISEDTSVVSAQTNGPTTIELTMSQNVINNSANSFDFTISGVTSSPGVFSISVSGNVISLFLTSAMVGSDTPHVSYK